jgi:hypothetical protein
LNRHTATARLTIAALLVFGACHDSAAPTGVTPSSLPPIVVPTSPSPTAPPSPTAGPVIQDGPFRFSPDMDPEGAVSLFQGDRMIINATGVAAANPGMSLRLVVDWGDGESDRAACGTCRVEHVYARTGRFVLDAVVDDSQSTAQARSAAGITRHAVVNVVARPVGQVPSPAPVPMPVTCNYPIPAPVWVSHSDGQTVSGTITLECALPPATRRPACSSWISSRPLERAGASAAAPAGLASRLRGTPGPARTEGSRWNAQVGTRLRGPP